MPEFSAAFTSRFAVGGVLGEGGMGTVYRARQLALDRDVALKVLRVHDADQVQRFLRESRVMAGLSFPGIVAVLDAGLDGQTPYLVCELIEGRTLDAAAREEHALDEVLRWIARLADALAFAHARGVVHRDVKPANAFLCADGEVKLADFGLAREEAAGHTLTASGMMMGTPAYMAPEQVRGEKATPAADVYQLGVTAFELVTGTLPFTGKGPIETAVARLDRPAPLASMRVPALPAAVDDLVAAMLDQDPAARPTAAAAAAAAERARGTVRRPAALRAVPARAISATAASRNPRRPALVPLLAACACVIGAGLLLAMRGRPAPPPSPAPSLTSPPGALAEAPPVSPYALAREILARRLHEKPLREIEAERARVDAWIERARRVFPEVLEDRHLPPARRRPVSNAAQALRWIEHTLGRRGRPAPARLDELALFWPSGARMVEGWDGERPAWTRRVPLQTAPRRARWERCVLLVEARLEQGEVARVTLVNGREEDAWDYVLLPGEGVRRTAHEPYEVHAIELDPDALTGPGSRPKLVEIRVLPHKQTPPRERRIEDIALYASYRDPREFPDPPADGHDLAGVWSWWTRDRRHGGWFELKRDGDGFTGTLHDQTTGSMHLLRARLVAGRVAMYRTGGAAYPDFWQGWYGSLARRSDRLALSGHVLGTYAVMGTLFEAVRTGVRGPVALPGQRPFPGRLEEIQQAETCELQDVPVSDEHPGFRGSGATTWWARPGQSLRFTTWLAAGHYQLAIRYAADNARPPALRAMRVNDAPPQQLEFPNTGKWEAYETKTVDFYSPGGATTIRFDVPGPTGLGGALNVDEFRVYRR